MGFSPLDPSALIALQVRLDSDLTELEARVDNALIAPERVSLYAGDMSAVEGTPATAIDDSWTPFELDAATDESVSGIVRIPTDWAEVNLFALWYVAAGAGDVTWAVSFTPFPTAGEEIPTPTLATGVVATAPAVNVAAETSLATGVTMNTSGEALISIQRTGTATEDTLAGDARLLAVIVERAL